MLRLNQNGKNQFNIVDDDGRMVSGTKEELNGLYQQLIKVKGVIPKKKENTHIVILENEWNGDGEKVQMKLSDSAYRLLCYLQALDRSIDKRLIRILQFCSWFFYIKNVLYIYFILLLGEGKIEQR